MEHTNAEGGRAPIIRCRLRAIGNNLYGQRGNDSLGGGNGQDWMEGGPGSDWLYGEGSRDDLYGGPGNDGLVGGDGNDWITADDGYYDEVICGPGYDTVDADYEDKVGSSCEDIWRW